jgi:hypothetical protein
MQNIKKTHYCDVSDSHASDTSLQFDGTCVDIQKVNDVAGSVNHCVVYRAEVVQFGAVIAKGFSIYEREGEID